jgi:hypothetical protein
MITTHAKDRITRRLSGIVTQDDISSMTLASVRFPNGKHYVKLRGLGRTYYREDSVGDTLCVILYDGEVKTAMLCYSSQTWDDGKTWRLER